MLVELIIHDHIPYSLVSHLFKFILVPKQSNIHEITHDWVHLGILMASDCHFFFFKFDYAWLGDDDYWNLSQ